MSNDRWVPESPRLRRSCVEAWNLRRQNFTYEEIAFLLGVSESTAYRWAHAGQLLVAAELASPGLTGVNS